MADVEPPELASLLAYPERSRQGDWSLRSALCRYAQGQPRQVSDVLDLVRRIEAVVHPEAKRLDKEGPALWAAVQAGGSEERLVGILEAMTELDRLGDVLAEWAEDRAAHQPAATVAATVSSVGERLEELGVPHEERVRPPGARSRG